MNPWARIEASLPFLPSMVLRTSTQESRWLWPTVFTGSGLFHLALFTLQPWSLVVPSIKPAAPVPIQLVDPSLTPTAQPSQEPATNSPSTEPDLPQNPSPPAALEPQVQPPPQDLTAPEVPLQPRPSAPVPSQPSRVDSPEVKPPPPNLPEPTSPKPGPPVSAPPSDQGSSQATGGQLIPLGIQADSQGRDLPDNQPQITQNRLPVQPLLAGCGWAQPPSLAPTALTLQLTVEADGRISQTTVLQGTGQPAVDKLVQCLVETGLRLRPATSGGAPRPTDASILQIMAQF